MFLSLLLLLPLSPSLSPFRSFESEMQASKNAGRLDVSLLDAPRSHKTNLKVQIPRNHGASKTPWFLSIFALRFVLCDRGASGKSTSSPLGFLEICISDSKERTGERKGDERAQQNCANYAKTIDKATLGRRRNPTSPGSKGRSA